MATYIGLDLGTTGIKAVLFDEAGRPLREASRPARLTVPAPGLAEQDADAWYELPCALIRELVPESERPAVRALGLSSQGISVVPVDRENRPLRRALSWLDMRAGDELRELATQVSPEQLYARTGKPLSEAYTLPKLLWLRRHEPELFRAADAFLMPMDYFLARATGARLTDPTMAGGTMLFDLEERRWSGPLMALAGLSPAQLAAVAPTGTCAGPLNAETCRRTGLTNAVAAVGAQDQKIAALGARIREGTATLSLGTAGATEVLSDTRGGMLPVFLFTDGRRYCLEGCLDTAGAAIRWARETLFPDCTYETLDAMAASAEPGCGGVVFRPLLSGAGGRRGGFSGLTLAADRSALMRAVLEGVAFQLRSLFDQSRRAGARVERIRAFGGGTQSDTLCRILSEVCAVPVEVTRFPEMAALGAAMAGVTAAGGDAQTFGASQELRCFQPQSPQRYEALYVAYQKGEG